MRAGNRVVLLTVGMVVLAGVLSGGAALWHTLRISSSYHETVEAELEQKGLVYGQEHEDEVEQEYCEIGNSHEDGCHQQRDI